jgi:hypothetical protein
LAAIFRLPLPQGKKFLEWDRPEWRLEKKTKMANFEEEQDRPKWRLEKQTKMANFEEEWDDITHKLDSMKFDPQPIPAQGPPFSRFGWYIAATLVEAQLSRESTMVRPG